MVTTFVLFLREGLEAALVIGMLLAALRQMGQTSQMRAVWIGAALAVVAALAGGIIVYSTIHEYEDTTFAAVFETITFLCAVVLLTAVTFWMQRHSRTLKHEIAVKGGRGGVGPGAWPAGVYDRWPRGGGDGGIHPCHRVPG